MKNSYFSIDVEFKEFSSRKTAHTIRSAWTKTLQKWTIICAGYSPTHDISTCGLCDLFRKEFCQGCPIMEVTKQVCCCDTPFELSRNEPSLRARVELNFLKLVKKVTSKK